MKDETAFAAAVFDALERNPDHIWIEDDLAIFGWGVVDKLDLGTGPDRYARARKADEAARSVTFASFTFDIDRPGSVAIVPETVAKADASGLTVLTGALPPPDRAHQAVPGMLAMVEDRSNWDAGFRRAMAALDGGIIEKVVLTREVKARFDGEVRTAGIVRRLTETQPHSYTFSVAGLVGSSPELLAGLEAGKLRSNCLAGTAVRDERANRALAQEKMIREHRFAADSVAEALASHCVSLTRGEMIRADFADIVHLSTPFDGVVHDGTSVLDIVGDLHPTAAVAGVPSKTAVELIRQIESHDRGRYAGPVGWFDSTGNGTFAIALRCGLIHGAEASLYAGAGLVAGSDSDSEYSETEIKLRPMKRALGLTPEIG